ncbi:transcriptional regulator TyrR [Vibrio sp. TH_r3]|uniref:transcriptional regulator TyrR n=1 Tax=Vibrio sp. TH_r3 TaxID=3082084 RepID=UPI00295419CD|nr:transcriptional regulator TyrR [Vibrio sp. TH_r3]MDV7102827.1 transcriptional regulator TyrR [Vibrio sp. TH_r3]
MRLEVLCEDRLGLTQELLELLVSRNIDLRGIEIDVVGIIYLSCREIEFEAFSELMAQIRRINGVTDVRKVRFMPSERHNTELVSLLANLPEPVLSISLKGSIDTVNHAACELLSKRADELIGHQINEYIPSFSFLNWIEGAVNRTRVPVVIGGLDYILDITPVYISGEDSDESVLASAVVGLKSTLQSKLSTHFLPESNSIGFDHFVGISNRHKLLISQAKKLSMLDQPLLIEGETGTGKEMIARACHARSERSTKPFLVLSCASMPDDVAETELFGHAAGAFNHEIAHKGIFEQADGGIVFLDEIGEMSPHLQIKLLRFLQDGTYRRVGEEHEIHVDVRVIASTKQNLAELTEQGKFREDLYYRLNVLTLSIPALRERASDVPILLDLFITRYSLELGIVKPDLDDEVVESLSNYQWPGNIRELENTVLRAITQFNGSSLRIEDFQLPKVESTISGRTGVNLEGSLDEIMSDYESQILDRLYQSFPSSRKLAKRLGVSHTSIANKLREYGIKKQ